MRENLYPLIGLVVIFEVAALLTHPVAPLAVGVVVLEVTDSAKADKRQILIATVIVLRTV